MNEVLDILRENAWLEFEVLWNENKANKTPFTILTDQLSDKINKMADSIHKSDLWKNEAILRAVIERHCPPSLVNMVGVGAIIERVPGNYLQAIVASWLASHFIYQYGLNADELDFYGYLKQFEC